MDPRLDELLTIVQEECAEVIQVISKVKRFGIDNTHLKSGITNRARLTEEVGDLLAVLDILLDEAVDKKEIEEAKKAKREKLRIWSSFK